MNGVTLSIIIVNWNTAQLLIDCLRSIFEHRPRFTFEVFVVDNASKDNSVDRVSQEFPQVRLVANQENLGFPKANNQALAEAAGEYLLLLNPDTLVLRDALEKLVAFAEAEPGAGVVGPRVLNHDGTLQLPCRRSIPTPSSAFFKLFGLAALFPRHPRLAVYTLSHLDPDTSHEVGAVSGSCMLVRRKAMEQVGVLDDRFFMYGEDLDWCMRFSQAGWKVYYTPSAEIVHFHGMGSRQRKLKSLQNFYHAMWLFHRKHYYDRVFPLFNLVIYLGIRTRFGVAVLQSLPGYAMRPRKLHSLAPRGTEAQERCIPAASAEQPIRTHVDNH